MLLGDWFDAAGALGDFGMSMEPENGKRKGRENLILVAVAVAGIAGASALYLFGGGNSNSKSTPPPAVPALQALATGEVAAFAAKPQSAAVPAITFKDAEGKEHTLADWKGRVVLLNLWATWCAPCRHEMPALDALKASLGGKDFDVVALDTDHGGIDKGQKFWTETGIKSLTLYQDTSDATHVLGALGMPTTLLIGRDGRELGRLIGPAEWASADAKALIAAALKAN